MQENVDIIALPIQMYTRKATMPPNQVLNSLLSFTIFPIFNNSDVEHETTKYDRKPDVRTNSSHA